MNAHCADGKFHLEMREVCWICNYIIWHYLVCMDVFPASVSVSNSHSWCLKARRQTSWNWGYRQLWATLWMLGIDPGLLEEQLVLPIAEPSFQHSPNTLFCFFLKQNKTKSFSILFSSWRWKLNPTSILDKHSCFRSVLLSDYTA